MKYGESPDRNGILKDFLGAGKDVYIIIFDVYVNKNTYSSRTIETQNSMVIAKLRKNEYLEIYVFHEIQEGGIGPQKYTKIMRKLD